MRYVSLLLTVIALTACNLSQASPTSVPAATIPASPTVTDSPLASSTPERIGITPTLLPLPVQETAISVTSVPLLGTSCLIYTTYSGVRSDNKLSLRSTPSTAGTQIFRVPNNVEVLLVPESEEVEAEEYHWLNVIYADSSNIRYWGWIARDSFAVNGERNPAIATLRPTGRVTDC